MSETPMILFGNNIPDVYRKSDIYDPDIHGTNPSLSGKIVPATHSLVVDNTSLSGTLSLWVVAYVNILTRKSTLIPIRIAQDFPDRVIHYGNEMLCLYYEPIRVGGRQRLIIDSKILMIGPSNCVYILYKETSTGRVIVSNHYDNQGNWLHHYVPLQEVDGSTGFRLFSDCFWPSTELIQDGDLITMQVLSPNPNAPGEYQLVSEMKLLAKEAVSTESISLGVGPIVSMDLESNQTNMDGRFVIYRGQMKSELGIIPYVYYANGHREALAINGENTFLYGMDDVNTELVGMQYEILVKHFVPDNIPSPIVDYPDGARSISATKTVIVSARDVDSLLKISPIPVFSGGVWTLKYIGSPISRENQVICTAPDLTVVSGLFNPATLDVAQQIKVRYTKLDSGGIPVSFDQLFWITLFNSASTPWWIKTDADLGIEYGKIESIYKTPTVTRNVGNGTCSILSATFPSSVSFIESFYSRALPPMILPEVTPPVPNFFNLKYASTLQTINPAPIAVEYYTQPVSCNTTTLGNDKTVIVEFLRIEGGQTRYLYSVPAVVN